MFALIFLLLALIRLGENRDVLECILKHKEIAKYSINFLDNNWYEYEYYIRNEMNENSEVNSKNVLVGVRNRNNFDCNIRWDNARNRSEFIGFGVEVLTNLKNFVLDNVNLEFVELDDKKSDTKLTEPNLDVILCDYQENDSQELISINLGVYSLLYKTGNLFFVRDIFILTFAGTLWLIFIIVLIILAICLRIATFQYSKIYEDYEAWSWVEITLWAIAAACQQGLGYAPNGMASRILFLLGYIMSYLLYTGFTAAITSVLIQNETPQDLKSISEYTSLACLENYECLSEENFRKFNKIIRVPDIERLIEHLNERNTIIMAPEVYFQYSRNKLISRYSDLTFFALENIPFKLELRLNTSNRMLKQQLRKGLNRMDQYGVLENILRRHNLNSLKFNDRNNGYSSATIEHVKSAIYIMFYGFIAAFLFIILELCYDFYKRKKGYINQLL